MAFSAAFYLSFNWAAELIFPLPDVESIDLFFREVKAAPPPLASSARVLNFYVSFEPVLLLLIYLWASAERSTGFSLEDCCPACELRMLKCLPASMRRATDD